MTKLCIDCPDHEACMTGAPCDLVKSVDYTQIHAGGTVRADTVRANNLALNWPDWQCSSCGKTGRARPHFAVLCTCGGVTWSGASLPDTLVWEGDYA